MRYVSIKYSIYSSKKKKEKSILEKNNKRQGKTK